jgi:uncharacterized membrane protein HdeD (DUF308 family)
MSGPAHAAHEEPNPMLDIVDVLSPYVAIGAGALSVALGALILFWPHETVAVVAVLFAIYLLVGGIVQLVSALTSDSDNGSRVVHAFLGGFSILVGLLCLRAPLQTAVILGLLVGGIWVVLGVLGIVHGIAAERGSARLWRVAAGLLLVIAGVVMLEFTQASLVTITWVLGIVLVLEGCIMIARGTTWLRSLKRSLASVESTGEGIAAHRAARRAAQI